MLNIPKAPATAASPAAMTAAATPPPAGGPRTLALTKPIRTHAGEQRTLSFRSPVGSDYMDLEKLPFDVRGDTADRRIVIDFKMAGRWIAALAGLDEIIVGQMAQADFLSACAIVNSICMAEGVFDVGNFTG